MYQVCVLINISSMAEMKNVRYNMNNVSLTKSSTSKSYLWMMKFVFWCTFPKLRTKYIKKINNLFFFQGYMLHVSCFNISFQRKQIFFPFIKVFFEPFCKQTFRQRCHLTQVHVYTCIVKWKLTPTTICRAA